MARVACHGNSGYGGHWITQLLEAISSRDDVELGIVTAIPGANDISFTENSISYFIVGQPKRYPAFAMRTADLDKCAAIIDKFKPDLIHIHGSERFYGLIKVRYKVKIPTVISIQGLLGPYSKWRNYFGALTVLNVLKSIQLIEIPFKLGLLWDYINILKGAKREEKILSSVEGFLGRTGWDLAHTRNWNKDAIYCHVGEILRPSFKEQKWSYDQCDRHTIIFTNAGHPRRGTENLLDAVAILQIEFPDIKLRLAGTISTRSGYGKFLRHKIKKLKISDRIELLGYLDDKEMTRHLMQANVFTITSYIENSPNSLAEAMTMGMPCVASFVGGIPSMMNDEVSGLLYPVDDVSLLVQKIREVFLNPELATRLGKNARSIALKRHDPGIVVNQLIYAYDKVLCNYKHKSVIDINNNEMNDNY